MKTHSVLTAVILMVCSLYSGTIWARGEGGGAHGGGYGSGGEHETHHTNGWGHGGGHDHYNGGGWGYRGGYGGYSRFGIYFGSPYYSYPYYGYSYGYPYPYYSPPVIAVPTTPPTYIQQTPPDTEQYPSGYWYYCSNPEGYYPYIKECPNGWQQVEPTPPPATR